MQVSSLQHVNSGLKLTSSDFVASALPTKPPNNAFRDLNLEVMFLFIEIIQFPLFRQNAGSRYTAEVINLVCFGGTYGKILS